MCPIGVLVGYAPRVDLILMRILDVMMAIPALVFALAVIAILGPGLNNVMLALGIAWIPYYTRMARGNVKRAKGNGYVEYAIATGATDFRIMFVHLLQSVAAPVIVMVTIGIGDAILSGLGAELHRPRRTASDARVGRDPAGRPGVPADRLVDQRVPGSRHRVHRRVVQPARRCPPRHARPAGPAGRVSDG